ncbi:MAG: glutamyl-tRNA amidotransferase [Flavobacteriales bacterium]|nr:glutamyl-tRNA amidotransferase [Flavobacteriales bacterium]|tara:strand:- start:15014 stop:15460 length:447 start_codon:yes stop_codon:yes gene_type:complete
MNLQEKINFDIKEAMKARNTDKLAALRALKSAIMLEATKKGVITVPDEVSLQLAAKLVKQRKEAASIFIEQNRKDLAQDEMSQLAFLEVYLPKQIGEDKIREVVKEVIIHVGASSSVDTGKCMGQIMQKLKGKADGTVVSRILREELS